MIANQKVSDSWRPARGQNLVLVLAPYRSPVNPTVLDSLLLNKQVSDPHPVGDGVRKDRRCGQGHQVTPTLKPSRRVNEMWIS